MCVKKKKKILLTAQHASQQQYLFRKVPKDTLITHRSQNSVEGYTCTLVESELICLD